MLLKARVIFFALKFDFLHVKWAIFDLYCEWWGKMTKLGLVQELTRIRKPIGHHPKKKFIFPAN